VPARKYRGLFKMPSQWLIWGERASDRTGLLAGRFKLLVSWSVLLTLTLPINNIGFKTTTNTHQSKKEKKKRKEENKLEENKRTAMKREENKSEKKRKKTIIICLFKNNINNHTIHSCWIYSFIQILHNIFKKTSHLVHRINVIYI